MLEIEAVADGVTRHEVKCLAKWFRRSWAGTKPFEVRQNDRDYQAGDEIWLRETRESKFISGTYTGRELVFPILYVFPGGEGTGLAPKTVVLGLGLEVGRVEPPPPTETEPEPEGSGVQDS